MTPDTRRLLARCAASAFCLAALAGGAHAQTGDAAQGTFAQAGVPGVITAPIDTGANAAPPAPAVVATPQPIPPALPAPVAPEFARVLSSTPVLQQVAVPRTVCSVDPNAANTGRSGSGVGALIGGLIGGAIGNSIGRGDGRAAATAIGLMGGAILGDQTERRDAAAAGTTCTTQTSYETRPIAWNVVYEYAGRQYSAQMPSDPGPWLRLQISPVLPPPAAALPGPMPPVGQVPMAAPAVVAPAPVVTSVSYVVPSTAAVAVWPAPVGVSLNLGYARTHWHRPPPYPHRW